MFPKLEKNSLVLQVYSNALSQSNSDLLSQLEHFKILKDKNKKCQPSFWILYKAKRVNRSGLGMEVMAFSNAFDLVLVIIHGIQFIMKPCITMFIMTDSLPLLIILTKHHLRPKNVRNLI